MSEVKVYCNGNSSSFKIFAILLACSNISEYSVWSVVGFPIGIVKTPFVISSPKYVDNKVCPSNLTAIYSVLLSPASLVVSAYFLLISDNLSFPLLFRVICK